MITEQSPLVLADTLEPALKAFVDSIEDDRGWGNDVLLRMYREGKVETGDISCDNALAKCLKHKLVASIMDNGENDYAYQLTDLGRMYCIKFISNRNERSKVKAGDLVTLDHVEYDNYYSLYKVVAVSPDTRHMAVSLIPDWVNIPDWYALNKSHAKGLIVMTDEYSHCTWDEEQTKVRSDYV